MTKNVKHLKTGEIGEEIACLFLKKRGFKILERNVNRKWGELDIVATKSTTRLFPFLYSLYSLKTRSQTRVHIIEVKTVSGSKASAPVHPAENLTQAKLQKLKRTAILYTQEKRIEKWQLDAVLVWYDEFGNDAEIQYMEKLN